MKTFSYTIDNKDAWALADTEIVIIAENKVAAKKLLKEKGYENVKGSDLTELKAGVHIIQESITE